MYCMYEYECMPVGTSAVKKTLDRLPRRFPPTPSSVVPRRPGPIASVLARSRHLSGFLHRIRAMHWPRAPALGRPPRSSHSLSVLILPDWQVTSSPDYPQNERPFHYFVPPQAYLKPSPLIVPSSRVFPFERTPSFNLLPLCRTRSRTIFSLLFLLLKSTPGNKTHFPPSARAIAIATTDRPTDSIRIWHQTRQSSISVPWGFRENPLRRPPLLALYW
ncbi:uncharacterized protein BDZ83DRAFT_169414 [Colletotrichum acutatum]|uniref:Uncharacterized protein n=1 Tax=Glomerella acutata TaxID=27357 RepID=A0AAD8UT52_GLOAC|nr:uncharacterized protein BDZ83DRAFT_169414 [Colletotrichum acutatum]KAK1727970.1 hypothetical protein BDZ83DRAFT_169414 [Colletotrichum acutatum]